MLTFKSKPFEEFEEFHFLLPVDVEVWLSDQCIEPIVEQHQNLRDLINEEAVEQNGETAPMLTLYEVFGLEGTDYFAYVAALYVLGANVPWSLSEIILQLEDIHKEEGTDATAPPPIAICDIGNSLTAQLCGGVSTDLRQELEDSSLEFVMYTGHV